MPRDRDGSFDPIILSKRQRVLKGYDDIIIGMYAKGLTQEDIRQLLIKIYKIDISKTLISHLISSVNEEVIKWQNRRLKSIYPFIYIDCLFIPIKNDLVSKKTAVYVMLGIGLDGKKEVLGIWLNETESATFWTEILEEIKERGVEDIIFISMDGLTGLDTAIETVYPNTLTQRCVVHLCRNLYKICPKKVAKNIMSDYKKIYQSNTKEAALIELENFNDKYSEKYPKIVKKVNDSMEYILLLFEYPKEIRKVIYTTNPIESLNSALRKVTNGKGSFPSKEAVIKVLYLRVRDLEEKWSKGVRNWKTILNQLIILHEKRITKHLDL
jgi:putative transposase